VSRVQQAFGVELSLRHFFESPTVGGLEVRIAEVRGTASLAAAAPPLLPVPRGGALPLSFAQQRLWFLQNLEPESAAYNLPAAVRLLGDLDVERLAAVLGEIVRRHETLRTTFRTDGADGPVQVIASPRPFPLGCVDLAELPAAEREREARALARAEAGRSFDLAREAVLRVVVLRLAPGEHVALFTLHHVAGDGWSVGVLVREVAALYASFSRGEASPLPELPVQYADYAAWQRRWLQGEVLERQLAFWVTWLTGAPLCLDLPEARPRPPVQTGRGAIRALALPGPLSTELYAFARRESSTLFMVLLAGFQVLLHARTGHLDLVVGTDVANRHPAETEGLIGFFVNQLALRANLSGNPTFEELLGRVRSTTLEAYDHQDLPFDRLVDTLKIPRHLQYAPVFQVKLVLQNAPHARLELGDLTLAPFELEAGTSQLDLNLRVFETPSGLVLSLQYSTDLFDGVAADRLLADLEAVLRTVVERPQTQLEEVIAVLAQAQEARQAERAQSLETADRERLRGLRRRPSAKPQTPDQQEIPHA
jgi:hypothetical protein